MQVKQHSNGAIGLLVRVAEVTNRTFVLPLLVVYPTSRCNSACVSCDWWRNTGEGDLALDEFATLAAALPQLGTQVVLFSGGEPLLRPDLFAIAGLFRARGVRLHLLTSGVLLERNAVHVASLFERVIVSLDATTEALYKQVRGVAALAVVERGVARLRQLARHIPITTRCTLHRQNYRELPRLIEHARAMGVDAVSFLAADVHSTAFGRERAPARERLALSGEEVAEFSVLVEDTITTHADDFTSRFVAESPARLRQLPQYYAALLGHAPFPSVTCNAPWMSAVVEADGDVKPCFFHEAVGNIRRTPLPQLIDGNLRAFRHALDVGTNAICERCVCSMRTTWRSGPWRQ